MSDQSEHHSNLEKLRALVVTARRQAVSLCLEFQEANATIDDYGAGPHVARVVTLQGQIDALDKALADEKPKPFRGTGTSTVRNY